MISSCGSFSSAMRTQYKKGIKAMFALLSSINRTKNASPKLLLNLFDKMVVPILVVLFASKKFSWIPPVKKLLDLSVYWRDRNNITSKTSFTLSVKKKLNQAFFQTLENQMSVSNSMNSKLDFYKKIYFGTVSVGYQKIETLEV